MRTGVWFSNRRKEERKAYDPDLALACRGEDGRLYYSPERTAEYQHLCRMASDIDAEIACLEGLDDWQADELARQATIRKRAVEKRIRDMTGGQL